MITFSYQARDAAGRIVSGIQEALNDDNAVTSLMSRGLMVLSLKRKATDRHSRKKSTKVKETDLVLFTRQLSTMVEAGISLVQALTALYEQADPKRQAALRAVVSDITARVQGGETFHESLAKHPLVFNRLFISMVKAGEHGGLLAEILDRLAGFLEASARLRKKVKSAMTYPVLVVRGPLPRTSLLAFQSWKSSISSVPLPAITWSKPASKKLAPTWKKATTFPSRFHAKAFSRRCSCAWSQRVKPPAKSTPCSRKWRTFGTKKSKRCWTRSPR